jgi:hypothetical protein
MTLGSYLVREDSHAFERNSRARQPNGYGIDGFLRNREVSRLVVRILMRC